MHAKLFLRLLKFIRATLSLEVIDQNNFAAGFYHLKVEQPIFHFLCHDLDHQMSGKG